MKNIWKLLGALAVLGGAVELSLAAAQVCQNTDLQCYQAGAYGGTMLTPFRVDALGNASFAGRQLQGTPGSGSLISSAGQTSSLSIPVLVSSPVVVGNIIVVSAATTGNPTFVGGIPSTTGNATTVIGVADATSSSGTVVNVNYSGYGIVLTTGAVAVGDLLTSSATASGIAATNNSAAVGTVIGTALTTNTAAASPSLTRVLLHH